MTKDEIAIIVEVGTQCSAATDERHLGRRRHEAAAIILGCPHDSAVAIEHPHCPSGAMTADSTGSRSDCCQQTLHCARGIFCAAYLTMDPHQTR